MILLTPWLLVSYDTISASGNLFRREVISIALELYEGFKFLRTRTVLTLNAPMSYFWETLYTTLASGWLLYCI